MSMPTVEAEMDVVEVEVEGRLMDGVKAECTRCGYETESAGTSDASVKRCLVLLREGCPMGEKNFYEGEL